MINSNRYYEQKLIESIQKGDENAFRKLFLKYYDPLCNFVWRYTRSKAISEDIVQNVFTSMWAFRNSLNVQRSVRSYLYQSVKNEALDYIKHQKVVLKFSSTMVRSEERIMDLEFDNPEDIRFINAAREAIDKLPDRACQIYKLHREDGLTYREIAEVMDISVKTVESQMTRALNILRNRLNEYLPLQITEETLTKIFT
jgi:RNA polymerase sigma-70 factor (ECF subfamily)